MGYSIVLTRKAKKDLDVLGVPVAVVIVRKLRWLSGLDDPLSRAKPLTEPAAGDVRFRIGDYRAIAIVQRDERRIVIVRIGHRSEVYR